VFAGFGPEIAPRGSPTTSRCS